MNSTKRYTDQTFTKRVDHEGGARRAAKKLSEPAFCPRCESLYSDGHWLSPSIARENAKHEHWRPATEVICPACKQIENHIVGGYVTMSGGFIVKHHDEIIDLIENEANRAAEDNPLSRVMQLSDSGDRTIVETTSEHLAQRLGHALNKAYSGEVKYDFSHENKVARVNWHRD